MSCLSKKQSVFNYKDDYSTTLKIMSQEFEERWNNPTQSLNSNLENYFQQAILGRGSFGTVLLVREKYGKKYFAAKMLSKELLVQQQQVQHVHNEKLVLNATRFPFLIHLVESSKDYDNLYLILPLVNGGELFTYLRKVHRFNEKQTRFYAAQVLLALEYLHNVNLIYRDLKPENILLDKRGYIKLTDFGFTKRVEGRTSTLCGTPEYLAPEIVQLRPYNHSVDWWAFGILIYEFVAGRSPFASKGNDLLELYTSICNSNYKIPNHFGTQLKSLVTNLLQIDVSKRLGNSSEGGTDVKSHPWFQSVEWYAMLNQEVAVPYVPIVACSEDISHCPTLRLKERLKSKINRHAELFAEF